MLDLTTLEEMTEMFHLILTRCRHCGVIEGCSTAFFRFTVHALSFAPNDPATDISVALMKRVLHKHVLLPIAAATEDKVTNDAGDGGGDDAGGGGGDAAPTPATASSVTRRSAGLPLIVDSVLSAIYKSNSQKHVRRAVVF